MAQKVPAEEKKGAVKAAKKETKEHKATSTAKTATVRTTKVKDPWNVLVYPHLAEKSMNMVEFDNKLTFIVRRTATKKDIKEAIETLFDVKVVKVQTETMTSGKKKAYAKLSEDASASEIASRLGMV
ncbi:MAG: 50S ribosomal protein L23 [Candidatus Aenigmarchaeota archaeon]|nr:50S ribosomal protein L23 [Candidatus Aenigmarchaeota archaeon]